MTEPTVAGAASHLWVADVGANTSRQLTFAPGASKSSERAGAWSPDGRTVYFVARRGTHTQLYRLPMNGGEAEPIVIKIVPTVDASIEPDAVDGSKEKASTRFGRGRRVELRDLARRADGGDRRARSGNAG